VRKDNKYLRFTDELFITGLLHYFNRANNLKLCIERNGNDELVAAKGKFSIKRTAALNL
jgi:hypothetical protein